MVGVPTFRTRSVRTTLRVPTSLSEFAVQHLHQAADGAAAAAPAPAVRGGHDDGLADLGQQPERAANGQLPFVGRGLLPYGDKTQPRRKYRT
jgi:hypothetical protein